MIQKYRFDWKKSDRIHYYSYILGMKDTISDDDMFVDITKTEIEQKLKISEQKSELLQERVGILEEQLKEIFEKLMGVKEQI